MSFELHMDFTKEMLSFLSLIAFIMFNDSTRKKRLHLLGLLVKYGKWGEDCLKNSKNWATQMQVMPFWTNIYLSQPYTLIKQFKARQRCYQVKPVCSMSSWTKLYLNILKII